jgi:CheY-like chemotaxis protein
MARILIIDDDPAMVSVISDICQERGHQTVVYGSGSKALENLVSHAPQLVITDLRMDKVGGLDILRECRESLPQTPVILITAYKTVETALEAMKLGAYDYITKPFKVDELQLTIQRALDNQSLVRENKNLRQIVKEKYRFENIIGTSLKMQEIYNLIANFDPGRKRDGQGTGGEGAAFQQHAAASAVCGDQLLGAAGEPAGERAFRAQEGIFHRRCRGQDRAVRGGGKGDHFPR